MNGLESGWHAWLSTAGGRVFAAQHGGTAAALAELRRLAADEDRDARRLQDEMETTRGRRPDLATARAIVHRDPVGTLAGDTVAVVQTMNRLDPRWRVSIDAEPADTRVTVPWVTDRPG